MSSILMGALIGALAGLWVFGFMLYRQRRRERLAKARIPHTCENCAHWDQAAGQKVIRAFPAFHAASEWMSPNDHSRSAAVVDGEDDVPPPDQRKRLPMAEDEWSRFGVCDVHEEGRHAIDTCDQFKLREAD